jgi:polyhydroxybutyrate depolymerase
MQSRAHGGWILLSAALAAWSTACGNTPIYGGGEGGSGATGPGPGPGNPCAGTSLRGNSSASLTHGGRTRTYEVHVPSSYDGRTPVPLVIDIHGLTSTAGAQASMSGWRAKADREGFIIVHPQGISNSWNGGRLCCGTAQSTGVDDVGFMRAIVDRFKANECVDGKRVYATGLSNGGAMSHRLACEAADVFAATAPVSMGNGTIPCNPSRPISVVMFRGTTDALVSYNGGIFPSAQADFDQWKNLNGCTGNPETVRGDCRRYSSCRGGVNVQLCTVRAGHVLYSSASLQGMSVPDTTWDIFKNQLLP